MPNTRNRVSKFPLSGPNGHGGRQSLRQNIKNAHKRMLKLLAKHFPDYRTRRFLLKLAGYRLGEKVFVGEELIIKDELSDRAMVKIGDRVAIADRVTLVVSSHANFSRFRSFMGEVHAPIEIGDDAWLGTGCIIFPGVKIGKGAVVGAGAVVTKDVLDFTVVVGNPARKLRTINLLPETGLTSKFLLDGGYRHV